MPTLRFGQNRALVYDDYGQGPPVVLLHGSPGSSQAWKPAGALLAGRFRILAPNLLGYGGTDPRAASEPPATAPDAEYVEALLGSLGASVALAGHSYGGNVALAVALRGRVPVRALILIEPVLMTLLALAGEAALYDAARAHFEAYIARVDQGHAEAVGDMIDFWCGAGAFASLPRPMQQFLTGHAGRNALDVRASFAETHSREALGGLAMPALAVYGDRSPEASRKIAEFLAASIPGGRAEVVEGAHHLVTATHPARVAELIAETLRPL